MESTIVFDSDNMLISLYTAAQNKALKWLHKQRPLNAEYYGA
jgi:hypothetical protein